MKMQRSLTKSRSLIPSVQEPENVPDVEDEQEQAQWIAVPRWTGLQ